MMRISPFFLLSGDINSEYYTFPFLPMPPGLVLSVSSLRVPRALPCKLSLPVRPQPITWPSLDKHNIVTTLAAAGLTLKRRPASLLFFLLSILTFSLRPSYPFFLFLSFLSSSLLLCLFHRILAASSLLPTYLPKATFILSSHYISFQYLPNFLDSRVFTF